MGDREQLHQALLSILNNAIEFSPKRGKVTIHLTAEEPWVKISVIDNGPGIPETLRQRVLDPFFTTHNEGTSLGLTIAQKTFSPIMAISTFPNRHPPQELNYHPFLPRYQPLQVIFLHK